MQRVQAIPRNDGQTTSSRQFDVNLVQADATHAQLRAEGPLDSAAVDALTAVLETVLAWGRRHVRLDLGGVTVKDRPCLHALVRVHEMYLAEHGLLVLSAVSAELSVLLRENRLDRALFITDQPNTGRPDRQCTGQGTSAVRSGP